METHSIQKIPYLKPKLEPQPKYHLITAGVSLPIGSGILGALNPLEDFDFMEGEQ
jgi:hypothetical protein